MKSVVGKFSAVSPGLTRIGKGDDPVQIGHDVFVGRDVQMRGGIKIGNGSIIAPFSRVECDIPPYSIYCKDRIVGTRYTPDIIDFLEELKWWDWTDEKRKANKWFFAEKIGSNRDQSSLVRNFEPERIMKRLNSFDEKIARRDYLSQD